MLCPQTSLEYSSKDLNHLGAQLRHKRKQKIFAKLHPKSQKMTPEMTPKLPKMIPKWSQGGPRWSQRTQIPNCFEAGLEMTPKWSHLGVHFGVFF